MQTNDGKIAKRKKGKKKKSDVTLCAYCSSHPVLDEKTWNKKKISWNYYEENDFLKNEKREKKIKTKSWKVSNGEKKKERERERDRGSRKTRRRENS